MDGRDESAPTPTECMLRLFTYTHIYLRTPTVGADLSCPHIMEYTVWITVYNQCLSSYAHCDTWLHLYNSVWTGAINRPPTPTECALRIVHVHQCLPTCTHCDAWLHLYNSIWTGAMNRPLRLRNVHCDCPRITTFNPRTRCYTLFGTLYFSFFLKIIYWIKIYIYFH